MVHKLKLGVAFLVGVIVVTCLLRTAAAQTEEDCEALYDTGVCNFACCPKDHPPHQCEVDENGDTVLVCKCPGETPTYYCHLSTGPECQFSNPHVCPTAYSLYTCGDGSFCACGKPD